MSERINVRRARVPSESKSAQYRVVEVVDCPKFGDKTAAPNCKHCEHCRIYLVDHVKCSYKQDKYKEEHPYVHVYNI